MNSILSVGVLTLVFSGGAVAGPSWQAIPLPAPNTTTVAAFPDQALFIGALYGSKSSPHYSGVFAGAKCLESPCTGTYSLSGVYLTTGPTGRPVTSLTTGIAQHMRDIGVIAFYAVGAAGMATTAATSNAGTTLGAALNGGVMAILPVKGEWKVFVLAQALSAAGSTTITIGVGFGWGK